MAEQITKREAVSRGMAHFGNDAPLSQMREWIKKETGLEMTEKHISTARGDILRKAAAPKAAPKAAAQKTAPKAAPKGPAKKPAAKLPAPTTPAGPKPVVATATSGGIPLDDILYIKELVGRVGPRQLHTLIDAFA